MKNIDKKALLISSIIAVLLVTGCLFIYKIHQATTKAEVLTSICNSFFVVGGVYVLFGALTWCSNHGAFIGLQYGFKRIFEKRRFEKSFENRQPYMEYRDSKLAKQKSYLHFILIGALFVAVSIVILFFI